MNKNRLYKLFFFLAITCVVFFAYAFFYMQSGPVFNSPDENAYYFFAQHYASHSNFRVPEALDELLPGFIYPRSTLIVDGALVPASFLGFPLVIGLFFSIVGSQFGLVIPALMTVMAGWSIYAMSKKFWGDFWGIFSAILFWAHPAVWYFSARAFLPNIVFIDLILFSIFSLFLYHFHSQKLRFVSISAFFLALAIIIRPSEVIWIGFLFAAYLWWYAPRKWKFYLSLLMGGVLPLVALLFYNWQTYGGALNTGYAPKGSALPDVSPVPVTRPHFWQPILQVLFPFGFDVKHTLKIFLAFFVDQMLWYSIPLALSYTYILTAWSRISIHTKRMFLLFSITSVFLGIYYGSWAITDNISGDVTIGASYMRYWLPIFVMSIFLIVSVVRAHVSRMIASIFLAVFVIMSFGTVYIVQAESLFPVLQTIDVYKEKRERVFDLTEEDAVILTYREDKIIFPNRKVIEYGDNDYSDFFLVPSLYGNVPTYFLSPLPDVDMQFLADMYLKEHDMYFEFVERIDDRDRLYKLEKQL